CTATNTTGSWPRTASAWAGAAASSSRRSRIRPIITSSASSRWGPSSRNRLTMTLQPDPAEHLAEDEEGSLMATPTTPSTVMMKGEQTAGQRDLNVARWAGAFGVAAFVVFLVATPLYFVGESQPARTDDIGRFSH